MAGDPRHDLRAAARRSRRARRRPDPRRRRARQRGRAAARRVADRRVVSWRWVFFVNVPVTAVRGARDAARRSRDRRARPSASAHRLRRRRARCRPALVALLLGLDQGTERGLRRPARSSPCCASASLLLARVRRRRAPRRATARSSRPTSCGNREFARRCLAVLLMSAIFFAALLYLPQFLTKVLGYSALQAGAGLLPLMATFAADVVRGRAALRPARRRADRVAQAPAASPSASCCCRSSHGGVELRARSCPAWPCSASASGSSTPRSRRPRSPRSTRRGRASPAASSTCARSPAARSASG